MKVNLYILFFGFVLFGCRTQSKMDLNNPSGNWKFDIQYLSQIDSSTLNTEFEGQVNKFQNKIVFHYGIDRLIEVEYGKDGELFSGSGNYVGEIQDDNCILDFEDDQFNITISGQKLTI